MVDHVRMLLLNPADMAGYEKVSDSEADEALAMFGIDGSSEVAVDAVLPLAMADDLAWCRSHFDHRVLPRVRESVYSSPGEPSLDGLYEKVLGHEGRWAISGLFMHSDPSVASELARMREAAFGMDAPYALGAVLLACAYRRLAAQNGEG